MDTKFSIIWRWLKITLVIFFLVWAGSYFLSNKKAPTSTTSEEAAGIIIFSPQVDEIITSPYKINGLARGSWFFEASFPIVLLNEAGEELGRTTAEAMSDWMTTDFVPFEAEISFDPKTAEKGIAVFKKDNPSGLPQNDFSINIPVRFR